MRGGILHGKAGTDAIGWVAAFLLAVGMLFLPVSKAYAGPVSGGSPGSGEMRGVWVSYLDWNGWAKDEAGYKKAMDQTLDLCVQKGLNAVFLQVRPDGDAMYPSQYFRDRICSENRERIRGMIRWHSGAGGASARLAASCVDQPYGSRGI